MATRTVTVNEYDNLDRLVRQTVTVYDADEVAESTAPLAKGGVVTPPPGFRAGSVTDVSPYTISINVPDGAAEALAKRLGDYMQRDAKRRGWA